VEGSHSWGRAARILVVAAVLAAAGCGTSDSVLPRKGPLSQQEVQQIKDLEAQRKDEWRSTKTRR
jgi:hypothetical protein